MAEDLIAGGFVAGGFVAGRFFSGDLEDQSTLGSYNPMKMIMIVVN